MNEASDLDVNVVSTTSDVLDLWMQYTRSYVEANKVGSFSEYWDSNFYYAPGLVRDDRLYAYVDYLSGLGFPLDDTRYCFVRVGVCGCYTRAYEEGKDILVDGYRSRPNPEGISSDKEQDIYPSNLELFQVVRVACESYLKGGSGDAVRYAYLQYAVSRWRVWCVTSLAICKVLGDEFFVEYVNKPDWFEPYMAGISAYEDAS